MSALNDTVAATLSVCRHLAQHQVLQASDVNIPLVSRFLYFSPFINTPTQALNKVCRSKATTSLTSAPAGVSNAVVSPRRLGILFISTKSQTINYNRHEQAKYRHEKSVVPQRNSKQRVATWHC